MSIFVAVSVGIITACVVAYILRLLKQPLLVGYLFAGLVLSVLGVFSEEHRTTLEALSQFGVTFLLFLVGLEMNLKEIPTVGKAALITGIGQIVFTSFIGYFMALAFGFDSLSSLYIAVALTFSSTVIIVKLLSEKQDLGSLYGKIAIGFLLVQDLVAVLILMFLSGFQSGDLGVSAFFLIVVKGLVLAAFVYFVGKYILPRLFYNFAYISSDLLFIASIAWALFVASLVSLPQVGFSIEIGGFLAGIALASSSEHLQIASRIKPLRDFFITIFFLVLGVKLAVGATPEIIVPALVFSLFVLFGNPLIVLALMGLMGYKRRTSFLASVTVAQISEFSFILVAMGEKIGHIPSSIVGLTTIVGVITMTASTYLIFYANDIYTKIKHLLVLFEKKKVKEKALEVNRGFSGHILLLGCDRLGRRLLPTLEKKGEEVIVIDFNPRVVESLVAENHTAFYGDVSDVETLEALNISEARLVVSTTSNFEDNMIVLSYVNKLGRRPLLVFTSPSAFEALQLYEKGADYVIVPQVAAGDHLAHLLSVHGINKAHFKTLRDKHFDRLARERF